jgi:hypothetical protein
MNSAVATSPSSTPPRTFSAFCKGRGKALERKQKGQAWLAHTVVNLGRIPGNKRLPTLEAISGFKRDPPQDADGIMRVLGGFTANLAAAAEAAQEAMDEAPEGDGADVTA